MAPWRNLLFGVFLAGVQAGSSSPPSNSSCRVFPGDAGWPSPREWNQFNASIGGKLIRGEPLARSCYAPHLNADACADVQKEWGGQSLFINDPVNVMSPYWQNDTCNPFSGSEGKCTLGNTASYAVRVTDAESAAAGIKFARQKNLRLTIKNTGHDYLGRSTGRGSLALWTHHLTRMEVLRNYSNPTYRGPALRLGAGVQAHNAISYAAQQGLRVNVGYCVTIGLAGGYYQNSGYGPLSASYGTASDNTLEFEVITADGRHLTASPTSHSDLFWALSGGGAGNYALVLSATIKAHADGPVAGAVFAFASGNSTAFWTAIRSWHEHLLRFDRIPGFSTDWVLTNNSFALNLATWPGATEAEMNNALDPYMRELEELNITVLNRRTTYEPTFEAHYAAYPFSAPNYTYPNNGTLSGRLIPRATVRANLTDLVAAYQQILGEDDGVPLKGISAAANNVTFEAAKVRAGANAVLPAWRDSLYTATVGLAFPQTASPEDLRFYQVRANEYQARLRALSPGGGSYVNEATFDDPYFKEDYYGENYGRLLEIKRKYDPHFAFWQHAAVGADVYWEEDDQGKLCRV